MISQIVNAFQEGSTGAKNASLRFLDTPNALPSPEKQIAPATSGAIDFANVAFQHESSSAAVLQNLDFDSSGKTRGSCGRNRLRKKCPLRNLIPRFYDPSQGSVLIDGIDTRNRDLQTLRETDRVRFPGDLFIQRRRCREYSLRRSGSDEGRKSRRAAKAACAHHFIEELPSGYDSILGESGVNLSR